jgi:hypothetical protein
MKKATSISLIILMIAAVLHISLATHYCGGKEVASKISLSGKHANCGMEGSENAESLPGLRFDKHCCDNIVTLCGTDTNFFPSFPFVTETFQYNFQLILIPSALTADSFIGLIPVSTDVSPPGALMSTYVDLSDICVFRI